VDWGKTPEGLSGLAFICLAALLIFATLPWRHPRTSFWKLMLPAYVVLGLSVAWAVWSFGTKDSGLNWWSMLWALPILIPFGTMGRRRWSDADPPQTDPADCGKDGVSHQGGLIPGSYALFNQMPQPALGLGVIECSRVVPA
jgi:hypothetical protein